MAFLSGLLPADSRVLLRGQRVHLRYPQMADYSEWAALRERSRSFLAPWEPLWPEGDLTRVSYRARMRRYVSDIEDDLSYPFFVFLNDGGILAGGLTLSNIRRGVAQAGTLGYWVGEPFANQGVMSEAVSLLIDFAFSRLGLHRIEAACLPVNEPSIRLLRKSGFSEEGYARRYLRIAGQWQDHLLFAILADDLRSPVPA